MKFELDSEESQLRDSLRRLLDGRASFEHRRKAVASDAGWDRALWPAAELSVRAQLDYLREHGLIELP